MVRGKEYWTRYRFESHDFESTKIHGPYNLKQRLAAIGPPVERIVFFNSETSYILAALGLEIQTRGLIYGEEETPYINHLYMLPSSSLTP
jgi:hypothetical protein